MLEDVLGDGNALEDVPGDAQGDAKHKGDVLEDAPGDTSEGLGDVGGDVEPLRCCTGGAPLKLTIKHESLTLKP